MKYSMMAVVALFLAPAFANGNEERCDRLGTAFEWEGSIEAACRKAKETGKLVLALHVSGQFDDPGLT